MSFLRFFAVLFGTASRQADELSKVDENGVPGYRKPAVISSAATAVLETTGSALGAPGVGSAIGVVLSYVLSNIKRG